MPCRQRLLLWQEAAPKYDIMNLFESFDPIAMAGIAVFSAGAFVAYASRPIARMLRLRRNTPVQLVGLAVAITGFLMIMYG